MGDGDAIPDARAHDLFAFEHRLQDLVPVGDDLPQFQRVHQVFDDFFFGLTLKVDKDGFWRKDF